VGGPRRNSIASSRERQQQAALYRGEGGQAAKTVRANADRERTVILADAQREAQKVRGDGDAKAIAIYANAYGQDKDFFAFYRSLQAYRDAFTGSNTSFVLNPAAASSGFSGIPAERPRFGSAGRETRVAMKPTPSLGR